MKTYIYKCKDGRTRVVIKNDDGTMSSKSYPRILMEEKLGRPLEPNEDVHHIDGNKENNLLDNLEIVKHGEHQRSHTPRKYFNTLMVCEVCGKSFVMSSKKLSNYIRDLRRGRRRGITCSKHCAYWLGKREQIRSDSNAECGLNGET